MSETLVLGIGNVLLSDDGAGVHALRELAAKVPRDVDAAFIDGGTLSFLLAPQIEAAERLIVLDAARFGAEPGTVRCLIDGEMDRFLGSPRRSVHEVSLLDLLDMARLTGRLPRSRALIGIEPAVVDWGEEPTPDVRRGIDEAVTLAASLLTEWHSAPRVATTEAIAS